MCISEFFYLTFISNSLQLGNVSAGNVGVYVPIIMQEIQKDPKKRYLLLHALKEVITRYTQKQGGQELEAHASEIWFVESVLLSSVNGK